MIVIQNIFWLAKKKTIIIFLCFMIPICSFSANRVHNYDTFISEFSNSYSLNKFLKENNVGYFGKLNSPSISIKNDELNTIFPIAINLETGPTGWPFLFMGTFLFTILIATLYYHQLTYLEKNSRAYHDNLNELNSQKLQFFSTINQDFKLPLSLILNPLEDILSTYRGDEEVKSKLQFIAHNVKHLINSVNKFTESKSLETELSIPGIENTRSPNLDSFLDNNLLEQENVDSILIDRNVEEKKASILLIDVDIESSCFIKNNFDSTYNFFETSNYEEALSISFKEQPNLIICNLLIETMNGVNLCEKLKKNIKTSHIPFVLMSTSNVLEYQIEGLKSGADFYMVKPFNMELLKIKAEKLLESRKLMEKHFHVQEHFNLKNEDAIATNDLFLEKVLNLLDANISDEFYNIKDLVSEMNMSRSTFYRKLKEKTGQSPNDFIQMIRLNRAAELLLQNKNTISEISFMVGFRDSNYFGKCFRKMYGVAPSAYAKE